MRRLILIALLPQIDGDVVVGMLAQCVGNPGAARKWEWRCGF
jgi:hypothetical protein